MKRALLMILAVLMVMAVFAACGDSDSSKSDSSAAGADSAEKAFLTGIEGESELDYTKMLQVSYEAHFSTEKSYSDYEAEYKKTLEDAVAEIGEEKYKEEQSKFVYEVTSVEDWTESKVEKGVKDLESTHKDTEKITGVATVNFTIYNGDKKVTTSHAYVIECDGRWYVKG